MCSKRCAKPVRPGRSFFEPTWYQSCDVHDRRRVILEEHDRAGRSAASSSCSRACGGRTRGAGQRSAAIHAERAPARRQRGRERPPAEAVDGMGHRRLWHTDPAGPGQPARSSPRRASSAASRRLEVGELLPELGQPAGRPPTTSASRGCRWPDSRRRTRRRRPSWGCRSAPWRSRPSPIVMCPATPTCPASITSSSIVRAARDADLRREQHVPADAHAVRDLHEVVDLRAGADPRLADGRADRSSCSRRSRRRLR